MNAFWNSKAKEHAPFYIASWRGFGHRGTDDFYLNGDEALAFVTPAGYEPTGRDRMLKIGCGIGRMTHGFAQLFGEVHAIDESGEMIAQATQQLPHLANVRWYETSSTDLRGFSDGTIDFCFSYIVFHHISLN